MRIKFDEPIIGKDNVLEIGSKDLDDFYVSASKLSFAERQISGNINFLFGKGYDSNSYSLFSCVN